LPFSVEQSNSSDKDKASYQSFDLPHHLEDTIYCPVQICYDLALCFDARTDLASHIVMDIRLDNSVNEFCHSLIKSDMALNGDTPAKKVGIKLEGKKKWMEFVRTMYNYR
jgi:hypothetical protein